MVFRKKFFHAVHTVIGKDSVFHVYRSIIGQAAVISLLCSGKRNFFFSSHSGPGTEKEGSYPSVAAFVVALVIAGRRSADDLVVGSISQRVILAVGPEVCQMFFGKIPGSQVLPEKVCLYVGGKAEGPAVIGVQLILDRSDQILCPGIVGGRIAGAPSHGSSCCSSVICGTVNIVFRCKSSKVLHGSKLCLVFCLCHRASQNVIRFLISIVSGTYR